MNTKFNKILAAILIAAMTLSVIPVFAWTFTNHPDSIWLEPPTLTGPIGTKFVVYCWANLSDNGYTYQVNVFWDNTIFKLNYIQHTAGAVFPTEPRDWLDQRDPGPNMVLDATTLTGPVIAADNALIGGTCMSDDFVAPYVAGTLFKAEFEVIAAPPKGGSLDTYLDIDNADTYILNPDLDEVTATKLNSHYHEDWVYPPNPHLAVDGGNVAGHPNEWEFGPAPPTVNGTSFDVDVIIKDLSASWWIHNATLYLAWNTTLFNMTNIVFDTMWATTYYDYTDGGGVVLDELYIEVSDPTPNPSGDVLIATITFKIEDVQKTTPPVFTPEISVLDIHDYELWDTSIEITTDPELDGTVTIFPMILLTYANLAVSDATMGPEPSRGEEFNVTVSIENLDALWYLFGVEFRLSYPADLIEPVACYEGPFLPSFADQQDGSLGTWFVSFFEPNGVYGPHVLVGNMILPNGTGWWHPPAPEGEGVIAIITFKVIYQSYGEDDLNGTLGIIYNLATGIDGWVAQNIVDVPLNPPVDGEYWITTDLPGRMLDLYGGAMNKGYGSWPFPAPYGGQGPDNPMDLVVDQSHVRFFAEVTYNYWPVQTKIVGFEVEKPDSTILLKTTAITNDVGIAIITFQMPWPCEDPESLFGVWTVTATVMISDVQVNDTLTFHYDYLIGWMKVTTDKFEYDHCEDVEITVEYGTHAQQLYPLLLAVVLMDELDVPVGMVLLDMTVGGAEYCTYTNFTIVTTIHVIKWAFAGMAYVHVNAFDKDPTVGGVAWCPEAVPAEICIQPF